MKKIIRIGSRGSLLALYQAEKVQNSLSEKFKDYNFEIVTISTKGDKILDISLSKIDGKGLFTKELENSLINGEIDLAVHSLKDLPTILPEGLILGGVLERGEVRDALVSLSGKKIKQFNENDIVGTSSLRRISQLLHLNKKVKVIDIRGNINTRVQKMENGYCNALLLAGAGLIRLGLEKKISELINPEIMIPAACQGIIGIEIRENDDLVKGFIEQITHVETLIVAKAERTFLNVMEGGCHVPVGCHTSISGDKFYITGFIADLKGEKYIKNSFGSGIHETNETALRLAKSLLSGEGKRIINELKR